MTGGAADLALYLGPSMWHAASGDKTWSGVPEMSADGEPSPAPVEIQRFLGGDWIAGDARMVPVGDALAGVLDEVLRCVGLTPPVGRVVVAYPTRWGRPTRAVVEAAVHARAVDTRLTPVAVAAAGAYAARADVGAGFHRVAVLEVDALDVTATVLDGVVPGTWRIDGCTHEPAVGLADDDFADNACRLVRELVGARAVDAVLVVGRLGSGLAERLVGGRTDPLPGPLRELDGPELVAALPGIGGVEVAEPTPPPPPVTRLAPARWLDADPAAPLGRDRSRRLPALGLAAAVLAVTAAGVLWLRSGAEPDRTPGPEPAGPAASTVALPTESDSSNAGISGLPPSAGGVPSSTTPASTAPAPGSSLTTGGLRLQLPSGWRRRDDAVGGRLELVPLDGVGRRIVLVRKELTPGAGIDQVAAQLADRIAAAGDRRTIGGLRRDAEFGGRMSLAYSEFPDDESQVDWHVLVDRDVQVSVGCQYLPGDAGTLAADCARIVGTVEVVP